MNRLRRVLKWGAVTVGSVVLLAAIAAIIIPLVVDVDKYRPQVVQAANERIRGKLDLGKLSLSVWGQIRIDIAGLKLEDANGQAILSVQEAFFHVPFASLFGGAPVVTLKMLSPEMNLVKDASGKLNAMSLMKSSEKDSSDKVSEDAPKSSPVSPAPEVTLPAIAARARLGLEFRDANLNYADQVTGLKTKISELNVVLKDVSLTRTTLLEAWANLDTKLGEKVSVKGPLKISGAADPRLEGGRFEKLATALKIEAGDLEIAVPGMFLKPKGVPAEADLAIAASEREIQFERMNVKFNNAELKSSGTISGLLTESGAPSARFEFSSNPIALKGWHELVPMMKEYAPEGTLQLSGTASGPVNSLSYEANLAVDSISAKLPKVKSRPSFSGKVHVLTDRVDSIMLAMKAPGTDLQLKGKVNSFTRPQAELVITSSGVDLDQWVELPPLGEKKAQSAAPEVATAAAPGAVDKQAPAASDYDALLNPLRENAIARATVAKLNLQINSFKVYDVRMADVVGAMSLKDLNAVIDRFSMKLWKGTISADGAADLSKKVPPYRFATKVAQLDLGEAIASQLQLFKNTVVGKADFQVSGEGFSFNPDPAMKNLKARGSMSMKDATFATIDVAKMVSEALNRAIDRVADKVPQLKGKTIQPLPDRASRYELISSDVSIGGGKFSAPNFVAKAAPNKGVDLNGNTTVGMMDKSLSADWVLIDTYNLTKATDLSVDIAGTKVERVLAETGKPLRIPVHVGCTLAAPCYSYTQVPEYLAKVAAGNVAGAAEGRAKEELRKRAAPLLDKAPPAVQKGLDEIRKKLFR